MHTLTKQISMNLIPAAVLLMVATLVLAPLSASAASTIVTPSNPQGWTETSVRGDGEAIINDEVGDSAGGEGSLRQSFSDGTGKVNFQLMQNFGPVSDITALGFDWFRDSVSTAPDHLTPALGVYVADGNGNSWLLKWEGVYNGYPTNGAGAPTDQWVTEDVTSAKFWRIPQQDNGSWVGFSGCNQAGDPYGCFQFDRELSDAWLDGYEVVGLEIGIGSGWNGTYLSFADLVTINDTTFDFEPDPAPEVPDATTGINIIADGTSLGCNGYTDTRDITVDWDDSSASDLAYYEYQADRDMVAPYEFTTQVMDSERSGMVRDEDGTYNYRVRAVSDAGLKGEWSDWCSVTLDRVAPVVTITSPADGAVVSGEVLVEGEVVDDNPENSFFSIVGPDSYRETSLFKDGRTTHTYTWDTTVVADGEYTIFFEARDEANNKDGSVSSLGNSVASVMVTVQNTPPFPETKAACKKGGYEEFGFKNQGKCIQFVNTGMDSR